MIEASVVQDILTRMKEIIHQELNFFSTDGIIIASTDPSRIGQVNHKGAQFVLEKTSPLSSNLTISTKALSRASIFRLTLTIKSSVSSELPVKRRSFSIWPNH